MAVFPTGAVHRPSNNYVWDVGTLSWVVMTQPGGGGGGGGAVTIADGADITLGAIADAAVITDTTGTISGKLRGLVKWAFERMPASLGQKAMAASFPVVIASDQSAVPVSGSVSISGTATVSGTVTANQGTGGTSPWLTNAVSRTATQTFNAIDQTLTLDVTGEGTANFMIDTGTLDGTIQFQASYDGGSNYVVCPALQQTYGNVGGSGLRTSRVYTNSPTSESWLLGYPFVGATHVRVRTTAYNSGTATARVSSSEGAEASLLAGCISGDGAGNGWGGSAVVVGGYEAAASQIRPLSINSSGSVSQFDNAIAVGISTTSSAAAITVRGTTGNTIDDDVASPVGTERGLIVRNIPSGTQAISASALPLPSGASTQADQVSQTALLTAISTLLSGGTLSDIPKVLVSDAAESYTPGAYQPFSMTSDGRIRVTTASESFNFSSWGSPYSVGSPDSHNNGSSSFSPW